VFEEIEEKVEEENKDDDEDSLEILNNKISNLLKM